MGRPFVFKILFAGLVFSGLDLLYGISFDLPGLSSSSDPLVFVQIFFIILCFVGAVGVLMKRTWGLLISCLVSFGFIIGSSVTNTWIPTLFDPMDYSTYFVAVSIVPILVLLGVLSFLTLVYRRNLLQKKFLTSGYSVSGIYAAATALLVISGAVIGLSAPSQGVRSVTSVGVIIPLGTYAPNLAQLIPNGAYNPSGTATHYDPSTITVVIGVNNSVTWTNEDYTIHTVTSDTGIFNSGLLSKGNSWTYTFSAPGTYGYHDSVHPGISGTVIARSG